MGQHWLFGLTTEGWSGTGFVHTGADGSPNAGCLTRVGTPTFATGQVSITGLNIPISSADVFSFYVKYSGTFSAINGTIGLTLRDSSGSALATIVGSTANITAADTWFFLDGTGATGTIASIEINIAGANAFTAIYFDTVRVREGPPPGPEADFRILGMAADSGQLYFTAITSGSADPVGTAVLMGLLLDDLLGGGGVYTSFGSLSYTDPDTFTWGIYPVVHPNKDGNIYLRGRDNVYGTAGPTQVFFRDYNGTTGWTDKGPGTATWGTAKFAVALMLWPNGPNNVIAVFSDDDSYQNHYAGTNSAQWFKRGDATGGARCAARSDFEGNKVLVAGTAAGTVLYTQNEGVSYTSGGTAAGTIQAFDWSYPNT